MRPRLLLAALVTGAAITAGCGVLLDLSHLDDGTGSTSTGTGGAGGTSSTTATGSSSSVASSTTSTTSSTGASSTSSAGGGSSGSSSGSGTGGDPGPPPPVLILVDIGSDAAPPFKIEATEVTVERYAAFVKNYDPATAMQHPVCTWNKTFQPNTVVANEAGNTGSAECQDYNLDDEVAANPKAPVRCIDWCDAQAFCYSQKGYLCHGNEGINTYPTEWHAACATAANLKYPYGGSFQPGTCVDDTNAPSKPQDVATKATCHGGGGFSGIFDMSGNVFEWIDCGCEFEGSGDHALSSAYIAGGSYKNTGDLLDCSPADTFAIAGFRKDIGARCCYAP